MVAMVFMILFIAIAIGMFAFAIFKAIKLVKFPMPKTIDYPKEIKFLMYLVGGIGLSVTLIFVFLSLYQLYQLNAGEWVSLIFGSLIFGLALPSFVLGFIIHYYAKEIEEKLNKKLFISLIFSGVLTCVGLLLLTNGIADHIIYPLVNGISFQHGFVTPNMGGLKPNIAWYAVCILSGAMLCYFISDHRFYQEYGKHGILESTLFVAFPAGIIGARVGYVIGEWNHGGFAERVANGEWWSIFAVWEGGLTVISGAAVGIIVGVIWFIWRNRKYSIWIAMDVIIPCILVAQAIGRWGNFFNCEVHGVEESMANWWFLPKMIANNAQFSESAGFVSESTNLYVPLFFVEFLSNLVGYFIIRFGVGQGLKKYIELGDQAASYIIWYGLTRVIMEPMRHTSYNMGNDGYWSWMWSIIFVLAGTFLIMANHLVRYIIRKKQNQPMIAKVNVPVSVGVSASIGVIGLALTILGMVFMLTSVQSNFLGFNRYNNGFIILTIGLGFLLILVCSVLYLLQGLKKKEHEA